MEVGPGLGCLSAALLRRGASVYAVEIDKRLANYLRIHFLKEPRFKLHEGDAIDAPVGDKPDTISSWKIVANLPYAISTPWLEHILRREDLPQSFTMMLQREAAQRFTAEVGSKHYGAITIFLNTLFEKSGEHPVARQCFYPVPGVNSQLLHLTRKPDGKPLQKNTRTLIRDMFTLRRKQIGALAKKNLEAPACEAWLEAIKAQGFPSKTRPESLPLSCWQALDAILNP